MKKFIGVTGCLPDLPIEFPIEKPENAGNMIHAQAPLNMFSNAVYSRDPSFKLTGATGFKDFCNNYCSHVILTMANTLSLDKPDEDKYRRLKNSLVQYEVPVVVFGLGIQAKEVDLDKAILGPEAISLIELLSSKCRFLGVRGEFTKQVIEKCTKVRNVFVTGCPSFFSRPECFSEIYARSSGSEGRPALSVTNLAREEERELLLRSYQRENFFIEPVSRITHKYYQDILKGESVEPPYYWGKIAREMSGEPPSSESLASYYSKYYRLFRSVKSWVEFNKEFVSFTYGTRFHVNMASLLSGRPALWLTHDARTSELVDFLKLPNIRLEQAQSLSNEELFSSMDNERLLDNVGSLFDNFNKYLEGNGLPAIDSPL